MLHPKTNQARISSNILSCYTNVDKYTTPVINQVEFEKAVQEDKSSIILDEVMQKYIPEVQKKLQDEKSDIKKSELSEEIEKEIKPYHRIGVVFDKVMKSVWVDIVDIETGKFKDNSLTRKLNLAGKTVH